MRICLQISKPEHKDLFYSGLTRTQKTDQVLCIEELKLQLLAKSSVCPGIITIIWSLLTSDTIISDEDTGHKNEKDDGLDDDLTELLNNQMTYEACMTIMNNEGTGNYKKQTKPVQIELKQNTDIFTQSNNNQKFMKK